MLGGSTWNRGNVADWLKSAKLAKTEEQRVKFIRRNAIDVLRSDIRKCRNCDLNRSRKNAVPFDGRPPKPIAIVGEAPGRNEDVEGKPFVGRSGSLLRQMMEAGGYEREQAVVMNVVCCRPPKNRNPRIEEIEACQPNYEAQLELSGAWVVLLMGQSALNRYRPEVKIGVAQGKPFWMEGRVFMPAYHPAYVLRNRSAKLVTETAVKLAFDIAYGRAWWPPISTKGLSSDSNGEATKIAYGLLHEGYVVIDSKRLKDRVVVVRDDLVKVPKKHHLLPRYSVQELVRLGELGKGARMTKKNLRRVHLVKHLGGTIVR
jgi:uracil-DNA glycosylase family 4